MKCSHCGSVNVRPSSRRTKTDKFDVFRESYRCRDCGARSRILVKARVGVAAGFLAVAATTVAVTVIQLQRPTARETPVAAPAGQPGRTVTILREQAEAGNRDAQRNLGRMYLTGDGVALSTDQAIHWFQEAAKQNDPASQNSLGLIYKEGRGVRLDYTLAARWFDKASHQGHAEAQYQLATLLRQGTGVQRDLKLAYAWYFLAARGGYVAGEAAKDSLMPSLQMPDVTEAETIALNWKIGDTTKLVTVFTGQGKDGDPAP